MVDLERTARSRVRRKADRGGHDVDAVHAVLDEGLVCHLGFALDGRTWVFPTAYGRIDDRLYLHGAAANFGLRALARGLEACVTVTLIDALVLARSAFHHSVNYRSVMLFGAAVAVSDESEKRAALDAIVEHLVPGRVEDTREPSTNELRSTLVIRFPIREGSVKIRTGGPVDDPADAALDHWAGQLPIHLAAGAPIPDDRAGGLLPDYVARWTPTRLPSGAT